MRSLWRSALFFSVVFVAFLGIFGRDQRSSDEVADAQTPTPAEDEPTLFVG